MVPSCIPRILIITSLFDVKYCKGNLCLMCIVNVACSTIQRQLENLGAQRAGLEDMLKEMKRKVQCLHFVSQHISFRV